MIIATISWSPSCPEFPQNMLYGSKIHSFISCPLPLPSICCKPGPAPRGRDTYQNKSIFALEDLSLVGKVDSQLIAITCESTLIKVVTKCRDAEEEGMLSLAAGSHGKSQGGLYREENTGTESSRKGPRGRRACAQAWRGTTAQSMCGALSPLVRSRSCVYSSPHLTVFNSPKNQDGYYCLNFSSLENWRPRD